MDESKVSPGRRATGYLSENKVSEIFWRRFIPRFVWRHTPMALVKANLCHMLCAGKMPHRADCPYWVPTAHMN